MGIVAALAAGCQASLQQARWLCLASNRARALAPSEPAGPPAVPRRLIIVTVDGVRWQEIFQGVDPELASLSGLPACAAAGAPALMPELHRLIAEGVAIGAPGLGAPVRTGNQSFVSLPGYLEIFGGRVPACTDNDCDATDRPTILDELGASIGASPHDVAVISSWETVERAASRAPQALTVSAGRRGGASRERLRVSAELERLLEQGERASAWPGWFGYRPDRYTAALALAYLRARQPRVLVVALGDPDELAHRDDYAGYLESLMAVDDFLGDLRSTLETLGTRGETAIIVTTDHGRSALFVDHGPHAPESGRVWVVASGAGVEAKGAVASSRPVQLADLAPTIRQLFALPERHAEGRPIDGLLRPRASASASSEGSGRAAGRGGRRSAPALPGS